MEITAIEPRRKGLSQLYIDGEAAVKIDTLVLALSKLSPGDEISDEELHELIEKSDARRASEKALYLLEHRNHSKKELTDKILRSGTSREAAVAAAERMEEIGLVDDENFARSYAEELFERKKFGARRVKQELYRKGIDPNIIENMIYEFSGDSSEKIQAILAKKYPLWAEDEKVKRRAIAALQRMGYGFDEINSALSLP